MHDTFDVNGQYSGQAWTPKLLYSRISDGEGIFAGDMANFESIIIEEYDANLNLIKMLWSDLGPSMFSLKRLSASIDGLSELLKKSQTFNYTHWNNLNEI